MRILVKLKQAYMMINMKKIYYSLWADAINYERLKNGGENHWKGFTFVYMSILLSLNLAAILSAFLLITETNLAEMSRSFLQRLNLISSERNLNVIWYLIIIFSPSFIITYFCVFYKNKYEYILTNYKFKNGRWLFIYFCLTVIAFFGFSLLNKFS